MLSFRASLVLALTLAPVAAQDGPRDGFDAIGGDPFAAGLFEEVAVSSGPPVRVMAQNVFGSDAGVSFVNVLRWADARAFRGSVISVRLPVLLTESTVETTARLWMRVVCADGSVAFDDTGRDIATSASDWTTLSSTGAIAEDATDLWFGLLVEGPTPVSLRNFAIDVRGEAEPLDVRHAVPERWAQHPDVRSAHVADPEHNIDVRVTSFHPPGHAAEKLPHLWLLHDDADLYGGFEIGRGLLESMRLGRDPPAIVSLVQPREGTLPDFVRTPTGAELLRQLSTRVDAQLASPATYAIASPARASTPALPLVTSQGTPALSQFAAEALRDVAADNDVLHSERVLLRWICARHDAGGQGDLADLLFEASLMTIEPWDDAPTVREASHTLTGHDCGHDHSHSHSHNH